MSDIFGDDFDDKGRAKRSSDFASLFEASAAGVEDELSVGDKINAQIISIGKDEAFVSTGTIKDGVFLKSEFLTKEGEFPFSVGDSLDLYVVQVRDTQIFLSPKPTAKNMADDLEDAADKMLPVEGRVTEVVKGGYRVTLMGQTAFCPLSQIDVARVDDPEMYLGKKFEFLITQFEKRNIVVSRRRLLDEQKEISQAGFLEEHKPGDLVRGVVSRLEQFGAFVELAPGLEGLVHISEISWSRLGDPSEALQVGQDVEVRILKTEEVRGRLNISLSIKQAGAEPWENLPEEIREGQIVQGRVTRCMKFGAFVELAPGIEGLIPLSEMSHTRRVSSSDELIKEGERISVLIKEIRSEEKRLLLSLKDAGEDPWAMVPHKFPESAVVKGVLERREPYGLFIKLDEGVVGLLPKSKALAHPDFPYEKVKIGEEVTVQVAEVRLEDRRISLGLPNDLNAEVWAAFQADSSTSQKIGTLGDQFSALFSQDDKNKG